MKARWLQAVCVYRDQETDVGVAVITAETPEGYVFTGLETDRDGFQYYSAIGED